MDGHGAIVMRPCTELFTNAEARYIAFTSQDKKHVIINYGINATLTVTEE